MFGSIKSFFTDIVAPVAITIASGGNPLPAAAYMGIKTGIETGSPLAGIGSAAFSYGIGSLTRGDPNNMSKNGLTVEVSARGRRIKSIKRTN